MTLTLILRDHKMNTVYINELGVKPWESTHPTNDAKFTTTTLLAHDFSSVWESWCSIMDQLSEKWPFKIEWTSTTDVDFNSKSEEFLFNKNIAKTLNAGDLCKKNEISNIYSTIKNLPASLRKIQNPVFEGSQDAILVAQEFETEIDELWLKMTIFEKLITPEKISIFLKSQTNVLLCRFYESETHAAAQIMYKTIHENETILEKTRDQCKKITTEDIHHFINRTKHYNSSL